jgi:hypothetical protein
MTTTIIWEPTLECSWDAQVAGVIACHCRGARDTVPADEEFQAATWEVPAGTVLDSAIGDRLAPNLRVTAGGRSWVLDIDRDGICGCGECAGAPTFSVVEVSRG